MGAGYSRPRPGKHAPSSRNSRQGIASYACQLPTRLCPHHPVTHLVHINGLSSPEGLFQSALKSWSGHLLIEPAVELAEWGADGAAAST